MSGCDRATHPGQVPSLRHSEEALYLFNSSTSSWQPLPHPFVALQNDQYLHCTLKRLNTRWVRFRPWLMLASWR